MSHQVILLGEYLEADTARKVCGDWIRLDVVSFLLVRLEIMKLFGANLTHLLPTACLEDLVDHSQMLVEVGNLLATLRTAVSFSLVHHLDMGIMV